MSDDPFIIPPVPLMTPDRARDVGRAYKALADQLNRLAAATAEGTFNHTHLMTPSWAGNELSEERRDPAADDERP